MELLISRGPNSAEVRRQFSQTAHRPAARPGRAELELAVIGTAWRLGKVV